MSKNILIIGGGVIGLCIAYYASRQGHRVTIIERGGPEHDSCSLGNMGMIVPSDFEPLSAPGMVSYGLRAMLNPESPFWIRPRLSPELLDWGLKFVQACTPEHAERSAPMLRDLQLQSRQCYVDLAGEWGNEFALAQNGLLEMCKTEEALTKKKGVAAHANRLGIPADVLSAADVRALDPGIDLDILGAVYFPKDCHMPPQQFVASLTRRVLEGGVEIRWNTTLTGWQTQGNRVRAALAQDGSGAAVALEADEYVIAGGSWTPKVAAGLGVKLPMQAGKGYSLTLPNPRQLPRICALLIEARIAVTPMAGTLRVGGTMEIVGLDESINPRRVQGITRSMPKYYTAFSADDFKDLPAWRGLRPVTPDGLPYVGRFARYANLSVSAGHAMQGMSMGPITGKLMAQILDDAAPSIDIALLNPDRYA